MSDDRRSAVVAPLASESESESDPPTGPARAALLRAARDELATHGVGGLSLRAVARRAGVSHAAPKHHFGDRAGLLTVLATDGHLSLLVALRQAHHHGGEGRSGEVVADLGRAYVTFALEEPALFELMFRSDALHPDDPLLLAARHDTFEVLMDAVRAAHEAEGFGGGEPVEQLTVVCWAFVHGLVVLTRDGALDAVASRIGATSDAGPASGGCGPSAALAHTLTDAFIRGLAGRAR